MASNGIRRLCGSLLALANSLLLPGLAGAQTTQPSPAAPSFSESVNVSWVLVPVVVRSARGLEENLQQRDFRIRVDGNPIDFHEFDRERTARWSLLLLQDLSGSIRPGARLETSQEFARCLSQSMQDGDELALAAFASGTTRVEVPFTSNRTALEEAIALWEPYGTTALHDAVAWIPELSLEGRQLRRAAVLVTDGVDNASQLSPAEARLLVARAEIPVYVLGFQSGSPYRVRSSGEKIYRFADVLNLLAHTTGGKYFSISKSEEARSACRQIVSELRFQFLLAFPVNSVEPGSLHRIEVEVPRRPHWFVRSRRHYTGGSPVTESPR